MTDRACFPELTPVSSAPATVIRFDTCSELSLAAPVPGRPSTVGADPGCCPVVTPRGPFVPAAPHSLPLTAVPSGAEPAAFARPCRRSHGAAGN